MVLITKLRKVRHGPLRILNPIWLMLGKYFRAIIGNIPGLKVNQEIGSYGLFKMDAKFAFSNFENWGGGHNNKFHSLVEEAKSCNCVLDVGAHIGLVTLPVSQVVKGWIYAFEPAAKNLMHLKNHIKYNKISNVKVMPYLLGAEKQKTVEFYEQSQATGMNSRVVKKNPELYHKTYRNQTTVDAFCSENQIAPDLIKIDVEGAEYEVIKGAKATLLAYNPSLYLSIHPRELELMGVSVEALINLLKEIGYVSIDERGNQIDQFEFSEYKFIKK